MTDASSKGKPLIPGEETITKELLEEALGCSGNGKLEIKSFKVSSGSEAGDNFASVILKVLVNTVEDGGDRQRSLLIKTLPEDDKVKEIILKRSRTFQKESVTYAELFPAFIENQKQNGIKPIEVPAPKFFYGRVTDDTGIIILEDLRPEGYKLADVKLGLDLDHSKIVMAELAKFHALSYALKKWNGLEGLKDKFPFLFCESLFTSWQMSMLEPIQSMMAPMLIGLVSNTTGRDDVKEKIKDFSYSKIYEELLSTAKKLEEPFAVFCHGDFWANNILFKYDADGRPVQAKFVDFQGTRYSTITRDLVYYFFIGTTPSLRRDHLKDLLALYHESFHKNLSHLSLEFPEFTLEVLQNLFNQSAVVGLGPASGFLFPLFASKETWEEGPIVSKVADGNLEDMAQSMINNSPHLNLLRERLTGVVEDMVDLGIL